MFELEKESDKYFYISTGRLPHSEEEKYCSKLIFYYSKEINEYEE